MTKNDMAKRTSTDAHSSLSTYPSSSNTVVSSTLDLPHSSPYPQAQPKQNQDMASTESNKDTGSEPTMDGSEELTRFASLTGAEPLSIIPINITASRTAQSTSSPTSPLEKKEVEPTKAIPLSKARKFVLLMIFCLSIFLDVSCRSGVIIFVQTIAADLDIRYELSTWIIVSFSVPFATLLLFWGRVADLFSPKAVFVGGFAVMGLCNIIVSFLTERYSFYVFRGISGVACSATVPAAYRLITMTFEGKEKNTALTTFSLIGTIANVLGLTLAAFFEFIPVHNQLSGWRWFFRLVALLAIPASLLSHLTIPPYRPSPSAQKLSPMEKWKRFDLIGCGIILGAVLMFVLSLTLGATDGWKTPAFLVPFLLAWPAFILFFFWERRLQEGWALVPTKTWFLPNMKLLFFISIPAFTYWAGSQLALIERWHTVNGEKNIITAVRLLPQGIAAVLPIWVLPHLPTRWKQSRWMIAVTYTILSAMFIPMIFSHGNIDTSTYWRCFFTSFIIASFFGGCGIACINVLIIISVPSEMAGVAGALLNVALQVGGAGCFAIQAGFMTTYPGSFYNFANIQIGWWFFAGWYLVGAILVAVFFDDPKKVKKDEETTAVEEENVEPEKDLEQSKKVEDA